jgi:hypothetical protein
MAVFVGDGALDVPFPGTQTIKYGGASGTPPPTWGVPQALQRSTKEANAMVFSKSVKYILRTPLTTALFMALFAIAAFFVSSGAVIWARNQATIKAYEDAFVTIGTVCQRASYMETTYRWDAFDKNYRQRAVARYDSIIPASVLDFDSAEYLLSPEKRPFYGALCPDLQLWPDDPLHYSLQEHLIVEITPLKDCVPEGPVEVRFERQLSEELRYVFDNRLSTGEYVRTLSTGDTILLCDHYNDNPQPLYAGKTYLVDIMLKATHELFNFSMVMEYAPQTVVFSTQHRPDGSVVEGNVVTSPIIELTDGFYETEEGRRWLAYADVVHNSYKTIPVLPTSGTQLLLPFYNDTAFIVEGEDISPEEYENGDRVCLVPENFAKINGLAQGDTLSLPLYYADYQYAPNDNFYGYDPNHTVGSPWQISWDVGSPLNSEGEPYAVFSDHEYTIKGIYSNTLGDDAAYAMGANTVVIPARSVRESDEDNIIAYGPMKDTTTTFQIPNGSIEAYTERWLAQGNDELEITFHDKGYTQLQRGLENMKRVAALFMAIGAAMSLALVFFFCHVFISKNKIRTAIERMLGYTKKQCVASLLCGFLLVAALSVAVGCFIGVKAQGQITDSLVSREYYDMSFTTGVLGSEGVALVETAASALFSPVAGLALLVVTGLVSVAFIHGNVKQEPLGLLGERQG